MLPEKVFLKVPFSVISLSSSKTVLEHSLKHSPAEWEVYGYCDLLGAGHPLARAWGEVWHKEHFWWKWQHNGSGHGLACWKWKKLRRSKCVLGKSAWPKAAARLGMSSPPSELTPRVERGKRKGAGKAQAGHGGSGGIQSLPSILCAWNSSSALPSNMPALLNQGTPKVIFTQLGKNRGREWYFVLSCPSPTLQAWDAGVWGITDRAGVGLEEQSSKIGQNFWGSDDVKLILGLGDRLDLVVRWLHAHHSRQRSLWIHHQQFQH